MDPGWPANPVGSLICILCKSNMPYNNSGGVEKFFNHMENDHDTHFNIELLLKMSLMQPTNVRDEEGLEASEGVGVRATAGVKNTRPIEQGHRNHGELPLIDNQPFTPSVSNTSLSVANNSESESAPMTFIPFQTMPKMSLIQPSFSSNLNQPMCTMTIPDFSTMDPISFVKQEPPSLHQEIYSTKNISGHSNSNPHLVPEDLQNLISKQNPSRNIKFTLSQRMNTQMVVNDYLLKKKKGPYLTKGGRVVNWKCINDNCQYTAVTMEGQIQDMARQHNHPSHPEEYFKKQVRAKIRESMNVVKVEAKNDPVADAVMEVVGDSVEDMWDKIGSVDAHKQAARRFNRKLQQASLSFPVIQDFPLNISSEPSDMMFTPATAEDIFVPNFVFDRCEVVGEIPADFMSTAATSVSDQ